MKIALCTALLFSICCVVAAGNGRPVPCCYSVSTTRIPVENIAHYDTQDKPLCPLKAIRFHTKKSKVICSAPDDPWAKKITDILDGITTKKPSPEPTKCYPSLYKLIQTTTPTNRAPGTQTETTSTTIPPIVTSTEPSGPDTSKSTSGSPIVTTTKTSGPETSKSTTGSPIVTTIETSRPKMDKRITTIQSISASKEKPQSSPNTETTCGTGEPVPTPRETPGTFTTKDNTVTTSRVTSLPKRTKPSRLAIKIKKKSKKEFRRKQMGLPSSPKNKSG